MAIGIGPLIVITGYILGARELIALGLPAWVWQITGFVIFALVMIGLYIGMRKEQQQLATIVTGFQVPSSTVPAAAGDYPKTYFNDRQLNISELARNEATIRDKIFQHCEIIGPALVFFGEGTHVDKCGFEGNPDSLLLEVPVGQWLIGGVFFVNCIFRNCQFKRIGILVTPEQLVIFRDMFAKRDTDKHD